VSHRGGRPGFVRIDGDDTLTVPDFNGNRFFNTLGNLAVHPRAGLLFIDFDNGDCCTSRSRPRSCGTAPRSRPSRARSG
jgi:predicted pyridoxine 5'-phosphate oxidase superfamily flavin-nucleotide-binding protein